MCSLSPQVLTVSSSVKTHQHDFRTKTAQNQAFPSSYRAMSLLETVGKLLNKILFSRLKADINSQGLLRDEKITRLPKHRTALQLALEVKRVERILMRIC